MSLWPVSAVAWILANYVPHDWWARNGPPGGPFATGSTLRPSSRLPAGRRFGGLPVSA
jgi:hypothetical protein